MDVWSGVTCEVERGGNVDVEVNERGRGVWSGYEVPVTARCLPQI